jgi:hypothetical protein
MGRGAGHEVVQGAPFLSSLPFTMGPEVWGAQAVREKLQGQFLHSVCVLFHPLLPPLHLPYFFPLHEVPQPRADGRDGAGVVIKLLKEWVEFLMFLALS